MEGERERKKDEKKRKDKRKKKSKRNRQKRTEELKLRRAQTGGSLGSTVCLLLDLFSPL